MSTKVQRLRLRLFAEGVELPCIAVQVQVSPNSPMVAAIQVPPLPEATRFLPRTLIHVFFLDLYEADNPNIRNTRVAPQEGRGPSVYEQSGWTQENGMDHLDPDVRIADERNQKYKLLFVGELMGFSWTKNATNRSVVLQCQDPSNYWDYAQQFNNQDLFGPGYKAMFSGGATNLFTDLLDEPSGVIVALLHQSPTRYPALKGLMGGIIRILEAIGGSYYYDKRFAGQNIFFSLAELRLRVTQMLTAYDKDPTSSRLLGGSYDGLFGRSIGNLGDQASFRKVISMLCSVIFHECYPQPCPLFVPGTGGSANGFVRHGLAQIAVGAEKPFAPIMSTISFLRSSLRNATDYMDQLKEAVPEEGTTQRQLEVEHAVAAIQALELIRKRCTEQISAMDQAGAAAQRAGMGAAANAAKQGAALLRTAGTKVGIATAELKARRSRTTKRGSIRTLLQAADEAFRRTLDLEATVTNPKEARPAQLKQQIFRPDVWFSAPPRCNVLFPDHYTGLSYSRQYTQEPTRLLLKTNDEFMGEDEFFDNFYFAPKAFTLKSQNASLQALLRGDIMDHEIFTGILPVHEKMGEFNIFAARSGQPDGQMKKTGLAQRSANFLYFKYRFASRQLQIQGRFNPYIACGFPGLVVDKYVDLQTFKLHNELLRSLPNSAMLPPRELTQMLGAHFLGNFTEVTHQVDQNQGSTLINCSYARQPEESIEFLGADTAKARVMKPDATPKQETSLAASLTPPRLRAQGPKLGRITDVRDVTEQYREYGSNAVETAQKFPVYGGPRNAKTGEMTSHVAVGLTQLAFQYGPDIAEMVGDDNLVLSFRLYEITEDVTYPKTVEVEIPPEEYIRPGWYGDCWHPSRISEVYYDFFGTGSITEPTQVANVDGASEQNQPFASSDATSTLADLQSSDTPEQFAKDQLIALALTKDSNIAQAVAFLVLSYSVIRQGGFDAEQFIRSYTWRPIATMLDMFGSSDLQLDERGEKVVSGVEGFHSRAFGPHENLFGLLTSDIEEVMGITRDTATAAKIDVRMRRHKAVLDYVAAIRLSRAILG